MSAYDAAGHDLIPQTSRSIERQALIAAGQAANRAAADHLFADYRQRLAESKVTSKPSWRSRAAKRPFNS